MKYSKLFASGLVLISQQPQEPQTTVAEDVQSLVRGSSPSKHERARRLSTTNVNVTVQTRGSVRLPFGSQGSVPSYLRPRGSIRLRSKNKSPKSSSPEKKSEQLSSSESTFLSLDISSDEKSTITVLDSPTLGDTEEECLSAIPVSLPGYRRRPSSVYVPTHTPRDRSNAQRRSSFIPSPPPNPWGLTPEDTEWQIVHSPIKIDEELEDWWQFHQDFLSENSK